MLLFGQLLSGFGFLICEIGLIFAYTSKGCHEDYRNEYNICTKYVTSAEHTTYLKATLLRKRRHISTQLRLKRFILLLTLAKSLRPELK